MNFIKWRQLAEYVVELEREGDTELAADTLRVLEKAVGEKKAAELLMAARDAQPS